MINKLYIGKIDDKFISLYKFSKFNMINLNGKKEISVYIDDVESFSNEMKYNYKYYDGLDVVINFVMDKDVVYDYRGFMLCEKDIEYDESMYDKYLKDFKSKFF